MNVFIHRRDLRTEDNTTLLKMLDLLKKEKDNNFQPIFIFNPQQIFPEKNPFYSSNLVEFLCDSLQDLYKKYIKRNCVMNVYEGDTINVLEAIHKKNPIKRLGFNSDYSPFSKKRDSQITKWLKDNNIECINEEDMLLEPIHSKRGLNPNSQKPYVVFTPFMKNLKKYNVPAVNTKKIKKTLESIQINTKYSIKIEDITKYYKHNPKAHVKGGRKNGLQILKNIKVYNNYDEKRNYLTYSTTNLSAYINLGILSIREIYYTIYNEINKNSGIITELYWRDFYYNILYHFPDNIGASFKKEYDKIKWNKDPINFTKWAKGETGFPVVDAAMRQMNTTGYMHNRGRMIVASFLTKDLLIDWREGEKYFATQLIDYNMSANNGGWQWAAGSGTDAQPYFRIFNPWTQSKNFDPECIYIKKWVPELQEVPPKDIHNWHKCHNDYKGIYIKPILDHDEARKKTLVAYKKYL